MILLKVTMNITIITIIIKKTYENFVEKMVTGMPKKNDSNGQWKNHKESVTATSSECGRHWNILISGWEGGVEVAIKFKYRIISAASGTKKLISAALK